MELIVKLEKNSETGPSDDVVELKKQFRNLDLQL